MSDLKRCENCKSWERYNKPVWLSDRIWKDGWGECQCLKFVYADMTELHKLEQDSLAYWDSESYAAGHATGKDFGCIHWQRRE